MAKLFCCKIVIFLFAVVLFCSCASEKSIMSTGVEYVIELDTVSKFHEFSYSSVFNSVKVIVLDNNQALLGEIARIKPYQEQLFILDHSVGKGVFVFDKNGRFIRRIGFVGMGPKEYTSCDDFVINESEGEIYIYDSYQHKIYKYDLASGAFKSSLAIRKEVHFDRILFNGGHLYGTDIYFSQNVDKVPFHILIQVDAVTGQQLNAYMDVEEYNKGWKDKLFQSDLYYNIGKDKDLFTYGLMDTIMCIQDGHIHPYIAFKSKDLVKKEDVLLEEIQPTSDAMIRGNNAMALRSRLASKGKILKIYDLFESKDFIYLSYDKDFGYSLQFNKKTGEVLVFDIIKNDIFFNQEPTQYSIPTFLGADDKGVYYCVKSDYLPELKSFSNTKDVLSNRVINKDKLTTLDEISNPVILYYEYKK